MGGGDTGEKVGENEEKETAWRLTGEAMYSVHQSKVVLTKAGMYPKLRS